MFWFLSAIFFLLLGASGATSGPTVICRDAGAGGYQAFPDVTRLVSGDLLCVFYAGYGHVSVPSKDLPRGGRIMAIRSTDEGRTWSAPSVVVDTPLDDRDPHISQLPDGSLMLSFFTRLATGSVDVYTMRSRSDGKRWSAPVLTAKGKACSARVQTLRDGTLILPVYGSTAGKNGFRNAVVRSSDLGRTWSAPIALPDNSGHNHDETDVIERPDGSLLAVIRPCMCRTVSRDGGLTWSDTQAMGFEGHAPCLLRTSRGILLMAHRLPSTSLHYSLDEGETWKGPVLLDSVSGAYAGLAELADGRVLSVYYEEGKNSAIRQRLFRADRDGIHFDD